MPVMGAYRTTSWFIVSVVIGTDMAAKPALAGLDRMEPAG
jgi:hypothetical protein